MGRIKRLTYVTIVGNDPDTNRVAQVIDSTIDDTIYALYINYNGKFRIIDVKNIRIATKEELKQDPKKN